MGLDGLRGVAILLVLVYHFNLIKNPRTLIESTWVHFAQSGWLGVDLFFVLSGFLITGILIDSKHQPGFFKRFYARRILRIFPLYYLFLIFAFWVLPSLSTLHEDTALFGKRPTHQWPFFAYVPNLLFASEGQFSGGRHLHVTWSLGIEEQFYIVWPLLIWITPKRFSPIALGIMIGTVVISRFSVPAHLDNWILIFCHTLYHSEPLLWGALACFIYRSFEHSRVRWWARGLWLTAAFATCGWLFSGGTLTQWNPTVLHMGLSVAGIGFAALLLDICTSSKTSLLRRFFEIPILRQYGKYAYGIYLTHVIVQHLIVERLLDIPNIIEILGHRLNVQLLYTLFGCLTSLLFGMVIYKGVEIHFLRLKAHFPYSPISKDHQNDSENHSKNPSIQS